MTVRAIEAVMALSFVGWVESTLNSFVTNRVPRKKTNITATLFFVDICSLQTY